MLREYAKLAEQCAQEGVDFQRFLLRLVDAEMLEYISRLSWKSTTTLDDVWLMRACGDNT